MKHPEWMEAWLKHRTGMEPMPLDQYKAMLEASGRWSEPRIEKACTMYAKELGRGTNRFPDVESIEVFT